MKALGSIPAGFEVSGGELVIAGRPASHWAETVGTPSFIYASDRIDRRIAEFRASMPRGVALHYAVKANPFLPLLRHLVGAVDGLDIASAGELARALAAGWTGERLSFAGPGKTDRALEAALRAGVTVSLESEGEADRMIAVAARLGRTPRAQVRINPAFELRAAGLRMGGGASPFGVDEARAPALVRRLRDAGADWRGIHVYAGTQSLDAGAIAASQRETVALAERIAANVGAPPPGINLGGGFGVPYFAGERPLDVSAVGHALGEVLDRRADALAGSRFTVELGRWLVADAGVYLTRIIDRKESRGRTFLVVDGGLHHMLAATGNLGSVFRRAWPLAIANRFDRPAQEAQSVVGCLCTPLDRFADDAALPRAEPGDIVAVFMAGAYGASASPSAFLSHGLAAEILA